MKAFLNKVSVKKKYLARVRAHKLADEIVKGQYWQEGKGCAVGCTIHSSNHNAYETELGIPDWLARVEDTLFEGLPNERAMLWPEQFLKAIAVGANLEKVKKPFVLFILESSLENFDHTKFPEVKKSIQDVMSLYKAKKVTEKQWGAARSAAYAARSAAYAARSAAESAAESAAYAAGSVAWSAAESAAYAAGSVAASAAGSVAASAAESAARSAAWSAAASAAASAARSAAASAARSAAESAAESAAYAAGSVAWSAAESAAASAAASAARSAAYVKFADKLLKLLKECQ